MHDIAVAYGDGIGPEIMEAVIFILKKAQAPLHFHQVIIGEQIYQSGFETGIEPATWEIIKNTQAFLKAPITTPQGGGFKSLNVTVRSTLGLYANIRPCVAYHPFISTKHPNMNLTIVRENREDLYTGIEYQQTPDVTVAHKLISRSGCDKIIRYAFDYARSQGRKKVSCFTKDNIMKLTDGLFHQVYDEIRQEYLDIEHEHWIIDIGAAKLADTPENFDVIVLPNLYGDILSDVAAQISGSVGLAPSANIGDHGAMFEAIHGSAPRRAGQNMANPSGLLLASVMMLNYLGEPLIAKTIHEAWLCTIEQGIHTYDIYNEKTSKQKVGTKEFAQAVIKNLGEKPAILSSLDYNEKPLPNKTKHHSSSTTTQRKLVGVDIYIYNKESLDEFGERLCKMDFFPFELQMIMNRGIQIWPGNHLEIENIEQMHCRFLIPNKQTTTNREISSLYQKIVEANYDIIKTENLYIFDNKRGFFSIS